MTLRWLLETHFEVFWTLVAKWLSVSLTKSLTTVTGSGSPGVGFGTNPAYQNPADFLANPGNQDPAGLGADPGYQNPSDLGGNPGYQDPAGFGANSGYQNLANFGANPGYQDPAGTCRKYVYNLLF